MRFYFLKSRRTVISRPPKRPDLPPKNRRNRPDFRKKSYLYRRTDTTRTMARVIFLTDFSEAYARELLLGMARYAHDTAPVSYTHLTLPTIRLV